MKEKFFLIFTGLIISVSVMQAQNSADTYAKTIEAKTLKKHVHILASDSCAGRLVGTKGIKIARDYILAQWEKTSALKPYFKGTWLQPFPLVTYSPRKTHLQANNSDLKIYKDYMYTGPYDGLNAELPIVFAGYGRDKDFENLNVKGKAVFTLNKNLRAAFKNAEISSKHGAAFAIIANPENNGQFESISNQRKAFLHFNRYRSPDDTLPGKIRSMLPTFRYITISSSAVKKLTGYRISHWKRTGFDRNNSIGTLKVSVEQRLTDTITANNIVAVIPGTDTTQTLIVGAHYDHLGIIDKGVYRGADDNASGTAALIELAKTFTDAYNDGYQPKINIVFIAFSGEEGGLYGSEYFVKHLENKDNIKLMINMDMIGRASIKHSDNPGYFYFIGKGLADSLYKQNKRISKKYSLTPDYSSGIDASDQKSFSEIGTPTIFYFDGENQDLHKTTDTPYKINYNRMEKITRMIFETIWVDSGVEKKGIE